jgi:hypothetical protein
MRWRQSLQQRLRHLRLLLKVLSGWTQTKRHLLRGHLPRLLSLLRLLPLRRRTSHRLRSAWRCSRCDAWPAACLPVSDIEQALRCLHITACCFFSSGAS